MTYRLIQIISSLRSTGYAIFSRVFEQNAFLIEARCMNKQINIKGTHSRGVVSIGSIFLKNPCNEARMPSSFTSIFAVLAIDSLQAVLLKFAFSQSSITGPSAPWSDWGRGP